MAKDVTRLPRSQSSVPFKALYRDLSATATAWMTEAREIVPEVHVEMILINDDDVPAQVRMINLGD